MSIECGVCERDLRSDHDCDDPLCPRGANRAGAVVSGRDANQLAADVRAGFTFDRDIHDKIAADAALDELVGLVGTFQQERDDAREQVQRYFLLAGDKAAERDTMEERAEAVEAALADLRAENERLVEKVIAGELLDRERAEAAEAALAEAQQQIKDQDRRIRCQRTALAGLNRMTEGDSHYAGRKRAEAALATTRQALTEISEVPYQSGRARGDVAIEIARRALAATDGDTEEGT